MSCISGVGAGAPHFLSLDGDSGADVVSVSGQLALLMLETQEQAQQIDHERLVCARSDFRDALAAEVQSLRDAADATRRGALLQAGLGVAGAGASIIGTLRCNEIWEKAGDGFNKVAKPLGDLVGTSYGTADAKSAEGLQQAARWEIDDCREAIRDSNTLQNKALDWATSIVERDAATTATIMANKA